MAPKIAIIGAGPGGLCLANILQKNNVPFTLFEGDKSPYERNQGGTLDLHHDFGQRAIKEAGLWKEFCEHSRPEGDAMRVVRLADGKVLWDDNGPDRAEIPEELSRPEIDREKLKDILFQNLNPENLRFGLHLGEVINGESDRYNLIFREGVTETDFDVVVGADGAWSKVRNFLTSTLPHYSGISSLELWAEDVEKTSPWLSEYVGAGSCFAFGEGRAVQAQRLGSGTIRTYASLRIPENFFAECGIDFEKGDSAVVRQEFVDRFFSDVGPDLQRCILECSGKIVPRTLYMLPVGFSWPSKPRVTLLGDAAHVMTPFAGVGVNAALADALDLAQSIIKALPIGDTTAYDAAALTCSIETYDSRLFPRGEKFAARTWKGLEGHFSAQGADLMAKKRRDAHAMAK